MKTQQNPTEWLCTKEFAILLGKPVRTVERWVAQAFHLGELQIIKNKSGKYRISPEVARSFIRKP